VTGDADEEPRDSTRIDAWYRVAAAVIILITAIVGWAEDAPAIYTVPAFAWLAVIALSAIRAGQR
jgi:hypothetical protein